MRKVSNIFNIVEVMWKNGKITNAYDLAFQHSAVGLKVDYVNNDIIINYGVGNGGKLYIPNDPHKEVILDILKNSYNVILGSGKNDRIFIGDNQGVIIDAGDGDDVIQVNAGNNWVKGGAGKDRLITGAGHDILFIDAYDIEINAGGGFDVAFVTTKDGINIDMSRSNLEVVIGNQGNDIINARLSGEAVHIEGGAGDDLISGSDYNDTLIGGTGNDTIRAYDGDDQIFIDAGDMNININCGKGNDTLYITGSAGIYINLAELEAENIYGGAGNDTFVGGGHEDYFLSGGAGDDLMYGGTKRNIFLGGEGNDTMIGGKASNVYWYGWNQGHDVIKQFNEGGARNLVYFTSDVKLEDIRFRTEGNDLVMFLQGCNSSLRIENFHKDTASQIHGLIYKADTENDSQFIELINQSGIFSSSKEGSCVLVTSDTNEYRYIYSESANNTLIGGNGNDHLSAIYGNNKIYTGSGDDFIEGGNGNDEIHIQGRGDKGIYGGSGADKYIIEPTFAPGVGYYKIGDFEINNPNEKIDFSRIHNLHSINDLQISTDVMFIPKLYKHAKIQGDATKFSWDEPGGCQRIICLYGITPGQVYDHPENFVFNPYEFDEKYYVERYSSVAEAIDKHEYKSGFEHWYQWGRAVGWYPNLDCEKQYEILY